MPSAYGAGAGADMLQEILKQKFTEAIQRQKLAEEIRQANMQNAVQQRQLGQGDQRIGLERDQLGETQRQFNENAPIRLANVGHLNAETASLDRQPVEAEKVRTFTHGENEASRAFQGGQGDLNRGNAVRIANINGANALNVANVRGAAPRVQQVHTVGPDGRKVVKLIDVNSGSEIGSFDAGMSPEDFINQLRQEAAARATGAAEGKQAAGGGGLFDMVAGLFGNGKSAAPAATVSKGTIRARDPQGHLHEAPAGTPLPAGWKLEG